LDELVDEGIVRHGVQALCEHRVFAAMHTPEGYGTLTLGDASAGVGSTKPKEAR